MPKLIKLVFPNPKRDFRGKRWVKISLRTMHLIGIAGVSGGVLLNVDPLLWNNYLKLTIVTGLIYLFLEAWTNGIFFIQVRGISILIKLLLIFAMFLYPDNEKLLLLLIIILSGVVSHAPGNLRYFSIFHLRRIDTIDL